jgi:hypothetical protein
MGRSRPRKYISSNPHPRLRRRFILGLQEHWPDLFVNLKRDNPGDVEAWAGRQGSGIRDAWLVTILAQTLAFWGVPDGTLVDVLPSWLVDYGEGGIASPRPFNDNRGIGEDETIKQYAQRMHAALSAHIEYVRDARDERRANPSRDEDIRWAVEMLRGKAPLQIQDELITQLEKPHRRPPPDFPKLTFKPRPGELKSRTWEEVSRAKPATTDIDADAIRKRAKRFAQRIGLTIPDLRRS